MLGKTSLKHNFYKNIRTFLQQISKRQTGEYLISGARFDMPMELNIRSELCGLNPHIGGARFDAATLVNCDNCTDVSIPLSAGYVSNNVWMDANQNCWESQSPYQRGTFRQSSS